MPATTTPPPDGFTPQPTAATAPTVSLATPFPLPGHARGRHLDGIAGHIPNVHDVSYAGMQRVRQITEQIRELGEIGAVIGDPGYGKTFAAEYWRATLNCRTYWIDAPVPNSTKTLLDALHLELLGGDDDLTETRLRARVRDRLADEFTVLYVDEAQRLDRRQLDTLRGLHDDRRTDFGLILIGGHGCARVLASQPELDDRIALRVVMRRIKVDKLPAVLNALHPIFAATDWDLLNLINNQYAFGKFRRWARLLEIGWKNVADSTRPDHFTFETASRTVFEIRGAGLDKPARRATPPTTADSARAAEDAA